MTTASTKRNPAPVNGVVGAAVTNLSNLQLAFTPFPVSPETAEKYKLESPRKIYVTGIFGIPDVIEGDTMTVDDAEFAGQSFVLRAVGKWTKPVIYTKIYMELQM